MISGRALQLGAVPFTQQRCEHEQQRRKIQSLAVVRGVVGCAVVYAARSRPGSRMITGRSVIIRYSTLPHFHPPSRERELL